MDLDNDSIIVLPRILPHATISANDCLMLSHLRRWCGNVAGFVSPWGQEGSPVVYSNHRFELSGIFLIAQDILFLLPLHLFREIIGWTQLFNGQLVGRIGK